jgi:multicomponent Na+:H+ antiporter subunit D
MAVREQHMKRRLAYSTMSNLSYVLFGVMLLTPEGLTAGLMHMVFHALMKITLFSCIAPG